MNFTKTSISIFSRTVATTSFVLFPLLALLAQMKISGKLVDATTKETLPGVTISIKGKKASFVSGIDGSFSIKAADGDSIEFSAIGYLPKKIGAQANLGSVELTSSQTTLKEVVVTNNVAIDRKTPVAVSTIKSLQIEEASANKEFPELLESTPSVFVTNEGGGAGDSKLSIRGFSQENISVMVNGVPVNDMENGAVFWSNWSGLREIASSVQVQRGLGASKLSIAAVGGNVNIVTKATEMRAGTTITGTAGSNDFYKTSVGFSTGKTKKGLAFSMLFSHTNSKGYISGTASEAYNYFATLAYEINSKSTITATITGAPQWHNQGFAQTYQKLYGNPNDPTIVALGEKYNNSWGWYKNEEFSFNKNFYHKPIANINYYLKINDKTSVSAVLYASIGRGGGTGALGTVSNKSVFTLPTTADGQMRFDDIDSWNRGKSIPAFGTVVNGKWDTIVNKGNTSDNVLYKGKYVVNGTTSTAVKTAYQKGAVRRANMNDHNWYGAIINLTNKTTKYLTLDAGIDLRSYRGLHYRRVEDWLGADAYYEKYIDGSNGDINNPYKFVKAGDKDAKIGYNYDGLVKQYGGYVSGTYEKNSLTAFVAATASNTSYQRVDYFHYKPDDAYRKSAIKNFFGYVTKGGVSYRFNQHHYAFVNVGYFEKAPFFKFVFANNDNKNLGKNLTTEKIFGLEGGYGYRSPVVNLTVNVYRTLWKDRNLLLSAVQDPITGNIYTSNITGLIAEHKGIELESQIRATRKLEFNLMGSLGDWQWRNNASGSTFDDAGNPLNSGKVTTLYTKGIKVGGTAQTSFGLGGSYEIIRGLRVRANYRYLDNIYATFQPTDRTSATTAGRQAWKLPAYGLLSAAVSYRFSMDGIKYTVRANVDNVLDKRYISSSTTDKVYDPTNETDFRIGDNGSGSTNTVYPGYGRTWVVTLKIDL